MWRAAPGSGKMNDQFLRWLSPLPTRTSTTTRRIASNMSPRRSVLKRPIILITVSVVPIVYFLSPMAPMIWAASSI